MGNEGDAADGNIPDVRLHRQQALEARHDLTFMKPSAEIIHHALHFAPASIMRYCHGRLTT